MKKKKSYLIFAIIIIGMCLRPSITGLGSLLKLIKQDLSLSNSAAGLLTTVPMITFAAVSPLVNKLNNKIGSSNTLFAGFGLIAAGTVVRSYCGLGGLYVGTVLIGSGVACGNVMLPAIIKGEFPEKYGFITALNSVGLACSSALASGFNYPIADGAGWGWKKTLCIYAVVAIIAIIAWFPVRAVSIKTRQASGTGPSLMKNKIAWSVTLFLGIEALIFYSCSAWLSTIFQFKGLDAVTAGYYVSAFQLTGIPASFLIPTLAGARKDQRKVTYSLLAVFLLGIVLLALTDQPSVLLVGALLAGFGCNGGFALSMAFIGFRTSNGEDAIRLSGMSQSIGYIIAAFGPLGFGFVNDLLGNWNWNLWIIAALLVVLFVVSSKCAKDEVIQC